MRKSYSSMTQGPLLSIYITDSAEAISYGVVRMSLVCLPYFLCGLMDVSTGALRVAWILTVFRIPQFHTPRCLYLSYPITWIITFAAQMVAFFLVFCRQTQSLTVQSHLMDH